MRLANEAVESARKAIRADLTTSQRRGLMHDRFVLLKRKHDLTDQERLLMDGWTKNYRLLDEAYRLKEAFYGTTTARHPTRHTTPLATGTGRFRTDCMDTSSR